jgi:hypothetical protein
MLNNIDIKYFYEKLLKSSGVPLKYFGVKNIIRMRKIKRIYGIERNSTNI